MATYVTFTILGLIAEGTLVWEWPKITSNREILRGQQEEIDFYNDRIRREHEEIQVLTEETTVLREEIGGLERSAKRVRAPFSDNCFDITNTLDHQQAVFNRLAAIAEK